MWRTGLALGYCFLFLMLVVWMWFAGLERRAARDEVRYFVLLHGGPKALMIVELETGEEINAIGCNFEWQDLITGAVYSSDVRNRLEKLWRKECEAT